LYSSQISQRNAHPVLTLSSFPAASDKQSMQSALSLLGFPPALVAQVRSLPLFQSEDKAFVFLAHFRKQRKPYLIFVQKPGEEKSNVEGESLFQ